MKNYQVTIGYRAVITVDLRAENKEEAEKKAIEYFKKDREKWYKHKNIALQDDRYKADGIIDMDETWNQL